MSRLEEIKNRYDWVELKPSHIVDINWLIQQADRVEESISIKEHNKILLEYKTQNKQLLERVGELEKEKDQDQRQAVIESLYADNQVYKRALEMIIRMAEDCTKKEYTQLVYEMESAARQTLEADKP